jgi:hypothetical protein
MDVIRTYLAVIDLRQVALGAAWMTGGSMVIQLLLAQEANTPAERARLLTQIKVKPLSKLSFFMPIGITIAIWLSSYYPPAGPIWGTLYLGTLLRRTFRPSEKMGQDEKLFVINAMVGLFLSHAILANETGHHVLAELRTRLAPYLLPILAEHVATAAAWMTGLSLAGGLCLLSKRYLCADRRA